MTPSEKIELMNRKTIEWLSEKVNQYSKDVVAGFLVRILADNFRGHYTKIFEEMDLIQKEINDGTI